MKEINNIIEILEKSINLIWIKSSVDNTTIVKSEWIIKVYIGKEMVEEIRGRFGDQDMIKVLEKIWKIIFKKNKVETKLYIGKSPIVVFK